MALSPVVCICILLSVTLVPASAANLTSSITGWAWEGQTVSMLCSTELSGHILWYVNGDLLPGGDRIQIVAGESGTNLTINPVFRNDSGLYTCFIGNETLNETSNALNLSVAKPPDTSGIVCQSSAYTGGMSLMCYWKGGEPAAEIELSFNGTVDKGLDTVNRNVTLDNEVQQPDLICQGNQVGKTSTCTIKFERPQSSGHNNTAVSSVAEGGDAKLTVNLTSQSTAPSEFSWFRLNPAANITSGGKYKVESSGSQSSLLISSVTPSENGTYECTASNIIGSTTFRFNLEVKAQEPTGSSGLSGGAIAGIVIGVLAGVALIGVGVFFLVKKLK